MDTPETKTSIWQRIQNIDRRVIYALLLVSILLPLFSKGLAKLLQQTLIPSTESRNFYNTIENAGKTQPNKIVIISGTWSASTRGENQWQTQAIIIQLMKDHIKFATISWEPQNAELVQAIADTQAKKYNYVYGTDYINWGYQAVFEQTLKGLVHDIQGTLKVDWKNKPLSAFPIMKGVKTTDDVSAVVEVTPSSTMEAWISYVQKANKPPILYAPTAVMAPEGYPYLDSGNIAGMLTGVKGAGDYEKLIGTNEFGTSATGALSLVYLLLIILIVVGNVGYFVTRARERRGE